MNTPWVNILVALASLSLSVLRGHCAEPGKNRLTRFDACPGSKITVKGLSNIHEWRAEGGLICGFLEVGPGFPEAPAGAGSGGTIEARGEVFIPVRNLRAVGKTWEPDNEQITRVMHRMLFAEEHPRISFRLTEPLCATGHSPGPTNTFEAKGELAIAGVTKRVSMPLTVVSLAPAKLVILGRTKLKQSDFNVVPKPKPVLDSWDNDAVEIAFEWIVVQKADK